MFESQNGKEGGKGMRLALVQAAEREPAYRFKKPRGERVVPRGASNEFTAELVTKAKNKVLLKRIHKPIGPKGDDRITSVRSRLVIQLHCSGDGWLPGVTKPSSALPAQACVE